MRALLALVFFLVAGSARADCVWTWDCTSGECVHVPVCHSTIDLPPLERPEIPPIVLPSIAPIPKPVLPPIGTEACAPRYVCQQGDCDWVTLCR